MADSNYITASQNYAKNAQNNYENSLAYLLSGLDETKALDQEAANVRYQNLITQIRQQIPGIQEQFERNAKAAYINKQQSLQQIDADLNRLGVNTQGFGVTQRLLNENAYGQAYGNLVINYNDALRDIGNQEINALGDLNAELADLDAAYAKDKLDTQKYIGEQGRDVYNTEYKNYYNDLQYQDDLKQQQFENEMAKKKYADQLKQQQWENAFKEKQYQDSLKQQEFENKLAQKEYELKRKQVNASISRSSRGSRGGSDGNNSRGNNSKDRTLTTNYEITLGGKAQVAYEGLIRYIINNNNSISESYLDGWLSQKQKDGTISSSQAKKIKGQFTEKK